MELNISNAKSENLVVCARKYKKVISSHCNLLLIFATKNNKTQQVKCIFLLDPKLVEVVIILSYSLTLNWEGESRL